MAAADLGAKVEAAIERADKLISKQLQADEKAIDADVEEAEGEGA